jgi:hypothetical protein
MRGELDVYNEGDDHGVSACLSEWWHGLKTETKVWCLWSDWSYAGEPDVSEVYSLGRSCPGY